MAGTDDLDSPSLDRGFEEDLFSPKDTEEPIGEGEQAPAPAPVEDPRVSGLLEDLKKERSARQAAQAREAQLQSQLGVFAGLKSELEQFRAQLKEPEVKDDDEKKRFEEDPVGVLYEKVKRMEEASKSRSKQAEELDKQNQARSQIANHVGTLVEQFRNEHPDYDDAYKFMADRRMRDYKNLGYPKEQWNGLLAQEAESLALQSIQFGRNPAEVIYDMAKDWGFKEVTKPKPAPSGKAKDDVERIASATLSGGGKAPDSGRSLLSRIDSMSEAEFNAFWQEYEKENRNS